MGTVSIPAKNHSAKDFLVEQKTVFCLFVCSYLSPLFVLVIFSPKSMTSRPF